MYKNVVITGANSDYFDSLLTLISSIHKTSFDIIDMIFVYDFGLLPEQIRMIDKLKKIEIKTINNFLSENSSFFEKFSSVKTKSYFLKIYSLIETQKFSENILWLDAGTMCLKSIDIIFERINDDHIFLVRDEHLNINFTHDKCVNIMLATNEELYGRQISAGILGYKSNGRFQKMLDDSWKYANIVDCIDGFEQNHRHDQSIFSILAVRYNCPYNDIDTFGYWTNHYRTLETAIEHGSVIFVHRRGHSDHTGLIYKNVID